MYCGTRSKQDSGGERFRSAPTDGRKREGAKSIFRGTTPGDACTVSLNHPLAANLQGSRRTLCGNMGHAVGYRNFECPDASTNVMPFGLLIGGEELHNNHHAFPSSAKFSIQRWEFDPGWGLITIFKTFGLAKVHRVAPTPVKVEGKHVDLETVRAVIVNRMHVVRDYTHHVMLPVFRAELATAGDKLSVSVRSLLVRESSLLNDQARSRLDKALEHSKTLHTVHEFRARLQQLWNSNMSNESLLQHLKEWIAQAEASGIKALQDFAATLRSYSMPAMATA